ncbi:DUF2799 domain-containing protein [Vibrio gallaecicus]|uniref:DUF2799 domain-containing protein n=2 Tax=Vibrio gallaecicus TaxID=552386 RepID=UPI0025B57E1C|nr:DUF2799 domain-containing protein [Vibrio gallaecicus]MDN3615276.1 DUF2799 domain-containing protein [Vibrio gallaecicus]
MPKGLDSNYTQYDLSIRIQSSLLNGGIMKFLLLAVSLMLVGCSQVSLPALSSLSDWKDFGEETALSGKVKQSEKQLVRASSLSALDSDAYTAYEQGYELGLEQYCSQNAHILGVKGEPYLGICDKINFWFQSDYNEGRHSMFGSSI